MPMGNHTSRKIYLKELTENTPTKKYKETKNIKAGGDEG